MEELIKKWKEFGIDRAEFQFVASGDSMGDTELTFYDKENKIVKVDEDFKSSIDREIYNNVEFYEVSDGHYMGEAGTVNVTLYEEESEEPTLTFEKDSRSEYNVYYNQDVEVQLNEKQYNYLKENVSNITNDGWRSNFDFEYSRDFVITEKLQALEKEIRNILDETIKDTELDYDGDGELQDDEPAINSYEIGSDNKIIIKIGYYATEYDIDNS